MNQAVPRRPGPSLRGAARRLRASERGARALAASRALLAAEYAVTLLVSLALLAGALFAFGAVAEDVVSRDPLVSVDRDLARWLHGHASEPWTTVLRAVTELGGAALLGAVSLLAVALYARRRLLAEAVLLAAALIGSELLTAALKEGFGRPRPVFSVPLATEGSFSFPSGHSSVSVAVYGALAFLLLRRARSRSGRALILLGCAILVALIAFSRLYLGVHYLSDVLAGVSIGAVWLAVCLLAYVALSTRHARAAASTATVPAFEPFRREQRERTPAATGRGRR